MKPYGKTEGNDSDEGIIEVTLEAVDATSKWRENREVKLKYTSNQDSRRWYFPIKSDYKFYELFILGKIKVHLVTFLFEKLNFFVILWLLLNLHRVKLKIKYFCN